MNTISKLSFSLLILLIGSVSAWAQPRELRVLDDNTLACEGKVRLEFLAGNDNTYDDFITSANLYLDDGSGGERSLMSLINTGNFFCFGDDTYVSAGFEAWCWGKESTGQSDFGEIESVTRTTRGGDAYLIVTIKNLRRRGDNDLNFRLDWNWRDGGLIDTNESGSISQKVDKKNFIISAIVSPKRDDCNPNEIQITATSNITCNESGFKYRVTVQKSTSDDFSSPMPTTVNNRIYDSSSAGNSIETKLTDNSSGTVYFKSIVEYIDNNGLVFQRVESLVTPVQAFTVSPPSLSEVSNDICENTINLKWSYNTNPANSFNIYRASNKVNALNFDGDNDCLIAPNAGSMFTNSSDITLEARVKLLDLKFNNIFYNKDNFDVYTNGDGKLVVTLAGNLLSTLTTEDPLPVNTWVHIAIIYESGNSIKVYLNGQPAGEESTSDNVVSNTNGIYFGCYDGPFEYYMNGGMSEVRIWNKALTEINPSLSVTGTESDLLLYYSFTEGEPLGDNSGISAIVDRSTNNWNAQLNNFSLQDDNSNFDRIFFGYEQIGQVNGSTLEFTDNQNIVSNQVYSYYTTAIKTCDNNTSESLPSNSIEGFSPTEPLNPSSLSIVPNQEQNTITLKWTDNAFDETAYEVHRRFGDATTIFTIQPNDSIYVDDAVVACRNYEYDIFAKNVCGLSNQSVQGSARLEPNLDMALSAVDFRGTKGSLMSRVELSWALQQNANVDRFRVYRRVLGTADSVQIDVVSGNTNLYRDETADAGILYDYTLVGEIDCDGDVLATNVVNTVGFRSATALVSGQVTYTGGNAVEGVKVLVAPADGTQIGRSLNLDGIDDKVVIDSINWANQSFTIEFWAKRNDTNAATLFAHGSETIVDNENLNIGFNTSGNFVFGFGNNELVSTETYNNTEWQHWTCVYDLATNKRYIYHNDALVASDTPSAAYAGNGRHQLGATLQNTAFFTGQMDELRVWSAAIDSASVVRDYNRILNGNEANIFLSYSFDEGAGYGVYDRSRIGINYNKRHAAIMGTTTLADAWSPLIPTPEQLGLYALTDENGNYIISSIPYTGVGQTFRVVPQFGTHQFEPGQRNLFIGTNADIFNGTDFADISSFPVTGTVFYKGTSCPADQIEIQVDGVTALENGNKVVTNSNGAFSVDVPIGKHRISIFKEGHEFEVGQFPTDGSLYDFQEPISGLEFIDSTKLKVIGRVVGGTREGNKVPGLGRSVNNIGQARVIYEAIVGNGCHVATVFTDGQTGEYSTELYPLKYVVREVEVISPLQNISTSDFFSALPQIDLVNIGNELTARDSVFTAGTNNLERVDSVKYNYRQDFIYRKTAEIEVLNEDRVSPFSGEMQYIFDDRDTFDLTAANMPYPIFERFGSYSAYIGAFEVYENFDANPPISKDKVPVTDGTLKINNQLAGDDEQVLEIPISDGDTVYTFVTGRPSFLQDGNRPEFSFTKTMDITLERPGQVEDVKWEPNSGIAIEDRVFRAYVVGFEDVVGSNFVSKGPEKVNFVLRDPPGDNSSATFTKDTEISWEETLNLGGTFSNQFKGKASKGAITIIGVGTATKVGATQQTTSNWQVDVSVTAEGGLSQTWTTSEAYSTNDAEEAVGARSDLYVGEAYNLIMGVTNNLEFVPNALCDTTALVCQEIHPALPFKIAKRGGFRITPAETRTTFIYDQNYIVNYLIPNLKTLRNNLFIDQPNKYTSNLAASDTNYGKNNDDPIWQLMDNPYPGTARQDSTGASYTWRPIPGNTNDYDDNGNVIYGVGTDSVRWYNQQIRLWETAIRDNEKDKIDAFSSSPLRNISLNGGTSFSSEESYGSGFTIGETIEVSVSKNFVTGFNSVVPGFEATFELSKSYTAQLEQSVSRSSTKTTTWAYEIKDVDQGDAHNIEVYKSPKAWGPIFRTIAGQTSCPHEVGDSTLFYQPGTKLNERTLQRDKIEIDIFPSVVQNVPEGEAAIFNIQLQNTSETNDSRGYAIRVDPASNPDGLSVSMDGETITVENEFALAGGSVQSKTITVERGPEEYEYEDIRLLVYAPCQYQAGTSDEVDIVDTVAFSVSFLPECTDIRLKEPTDLWVVNTFNQDTLPITIDNYDINKNGFESVSLQYRPASEATWRELNKWWHPVNRADEMGDQIPTNSSFIRYDWDMSSNVDGPYHLRVVSGCELADKETEFKQGTADRINPTPFGTPSPSDGICDPGEDLKIKFNEPIDIGSLTSLNFDIRGVLNGTELRHSESIAFDGNNDYIDITAYDLTKRSFAVEFWAKPNTNNAGTIFSQGSDPANALIVGFDASGRFQLNLAGQVLTADAATPSGEWKHFVASFDYEMNTASLFIDGVEEKVSNSFTMPYTGIGSIRLGQDISGAGAAFNGNLHELRLWSAARTAIDIVPNMNISLSPTTAGLIGYWQMNEGIGTIAKDRVRSRNGVLSGATWSILPVGYAFDFNGSSDYLEVTNAGLLTMSNESDITIEAWFKTTAAATLLSNGKGDGSDTETSWAVGLNADGKIVLNNNANTFEGTTAGLLDDNWHHLAIVLERNSAIKLYVDGALSTTSSANGYQGFAGSKLWIGARGWFDGSVEMRDQYFNGSLDEIRIWNTARRIEQIERDWVNRLSGDELGLLAYYPFETYTLDAGVPVLSQSIMDESMNTFDLSLGTGTSSNLQQATPPIKLQRPVQKVNFTYTVNQDEIILTPTDPSGRLEHVTLDITVKDVKDKYGNVLQSPATWIAFINKNQVVWDRDEVEQAVQTGEATTFDVSIVNIGGSAERYDLLNLPAWLTASPSSGTIAPNSSLNVTFTIAEGVNIGNYEQDIYLSTDFGFNERLILKLKVSADAPEWTFDNSQFQHSMSYVGELKINGTISTDVEDQLSVFVEEELRGVANVELDPITNKYLVFLDVYSNEVTGEALEFRIWDASEGKINLPVSPTDHIFLLHEFVGTPETPQIFEAQGSIGQAYSLDAGWNWISFPLASSVLMDVNETLDGLDAADNDRILSQDAFDTYLESDGWVGSLSNTGGFNRKEGYKVYLTNPGTFSYSGILGNPASEPITLAAGWNWIGMIALDKIEINAALASLSPTDGDVIKGQRRFAVYEAGLGWAGSLDFLEPTEGYMIKLANGGTLTYPNAAASTAPNDALVKSYKRLELLQAQMNLEVKAFEQTMSLVATFEDCNKRAIGQDTYLAAYVNDECRGIYPVEWNGKTPLAYVTLHANAGEVLSFRLIDEAKQTAYILNEQLAFDADAVLGTTSKPMLMTALENCKLLDIPTGSQTNHLNEVNIYPNPFSEHLTIEIDVEMEEDAHVTLQDVTGRTLATIFNGKLEGGSNKLLWHEEAVQQLPSGIYFIHIQSNTIKHIEKVIR